MTYGTDNWRKCKICGEFFDIATCYSECPACRDKRVIMSKRGLERWMPLM